MTEERRMARDAEEPDKSGPAGGGRWADYLDWLRGEMIRDVLALPIEEQRRSVVPSGWTPIELLNHVLFMEERWFVWGFLGEAVAEPWGDWNVDEPWRDDVDARWEVPVEVTADAIADRLEATGRRTRQILASHPADARAATSGRFSDDPPTLDWICFHVLAEYARHAGHLDIAVELR